ncbi:MAG: iron-sulfur cluster biosynthesis family protein [Chloroherpetonaceae bacterium]|nr:iron-sulfur cluster biosynthesis family protein [Chloroherpetonaceae bacterium]
MTVFITKTAQGHLEELVASGQIHSRRFRLILKGVAQAMPILEIQFDMIPSDDDAFLRQAGFEIYIDRNSKKHADGAIIDFLETPFGGTLTVENPYRI